MRVCPLVSEELLEGVVLGALQLEAHLRPWRVVMCEAQVGEPEDSLAVLVCKHSRHGRGSGGAMCPLGDVANVTGAHAWLHDNLNLLHVHVAAWGTSPGGVSLVGAALVLHLEAVLVGFRTLNKAQAEWNASVGAAPALVVWEATCWWARWWGWWEADR